MMLEQLPVFFESAFMVHCNKCLSILFEIKIIDELVRYRNNNKKKPFTKTQKQQDAANYYMLHSNIMPSTIKIQNAPYLSKSNPFSMLFLSQIKCIKCSEKIGIKILSVSSQFCNYQLLGRLLILSNKVSIKTVKQDVTDQVTARFNQQWECSNQLETNQYFDDYPRQTHIISKVQKIQRVQKVEEISNNRYIISQNKRIKQRQIRSVRNKQQTKNNNKNENIIDRNSIQYREKYQRQYFREKLLQQSQETKQIIKQIVGSIQFYNDILASLEKRVAQSENVCNVLKKKVQQIIPLIRKKSKD